MSKLAVVAVGGNSLIKDEAHKSVPDQFNAVRETARHIAEMIAQGWNVVVTHGNGPQVGFIVQRSDMALPLLHPVPLDSCDADTQGAIGYMIQQALYNEFLRRGMQRQCVTIVTQVLVERDDPAMQHPSKPIGSFYGANEARVMMEREGWRMIEDAGRGWRRVVPSPQPRKIIESAAISTLLGAGFVVVAVGGGGIPVVRDQTGKLAGVEGVIDKDLASSLLATHLQADLLLISTSIEKVALNYRQPGQRNLDRVTLSEARRYAADGHFARGSMEPKVQAMINYLDQGGKAGLITLPEMFAPALAGQTGTWFVPDN
ncbi:MAG TPA: carbamate kinase [Ktedonobacteraceae bacterium]|nr:carbamate kinase [Ktedonobacteraceae bacterium]